MTRAARTTRGGRPWSRVAKLAASVAIVLHVAAVFVPPFTFATSTGPGEASPFAAPLMTALRPYVDALFLNHGYFFFAPNPGPNHLLRVELLDDDGRPFESFLLPDRKRLWPRLYYHRHFMMTETLNGMYVPAEIPPELAQDEVAVAAWRAERQRYERLREAYRRHLQVATGAAAVRLTRVEHRQPTPYEYLEEGVGLTDPRLYRDLPD